MADTYSDYFVPTYTRAKPAMVRGKGTYLYNANGKRFLDFGSGISVTALGHSNPQIVAVLKKQGSMLLHASNLYHMEPQIKLAKLLVKHSFGDKVFFCNSGTEAIEAAIKFARKWATGRNPEKYHILSFTGSFHGRTYGALSATVQGKFHQGFGPFVPGFHHAPFNDITKAQRMLSKHEYAAIVVEPIQGESGINGARTDFLKFLRQWTNRHGTALIFDEIQCGTGRSGTLWNYEQHGVAPDIMAVAKPIGGGLPLGAVICKEKIAGAISSGSHGTTFGGNPLACALGCVVVKTVARKSFLKAVRAKGDLLKTGLAKIVSESHRATGVVGTGLMIGVRMKEDPGPVIAQCRKAGLLVIKAGCNTVRFMPPLTVSEREIARAVRIFAKTLDQSG